jgi:hypothetical protein
MKHERCSEYIVLRVAPTLREEIERAGYPPVDTRLYPPDRSRWWPREDGHTPAADGIFKRRAATTRILVDLMAGPRLPFYAVIIGAPARRGGADCRCCIIRSCSSQRAAACCQKARSSPSTACLASSRHSSICLLKNGSNALTPDFRSVVSPRWRRPPRFGVFEMSRRAPTPHNETIKS